MRHIRWCSVVCVSVCLSVCLLVTIVNCGNMAEPMEMLFEMVVSTDCRSVWQCCPLVNSVKLTQVLIDACCANLSLINPRVTGWKPKEPWGQIPPWEGAALRDDIRSFMQPVDQHSDWPAAAWRSRIGLLHSILSWKIRIFCDAACFQITLGDLVHNSYSQYQNYENYEQFYNRNESVHNKSTCRNVASADKKFVTEIKIQLYLS